MVLPAELLSVNYAAPVRSFLMRNFKRVELFTFDQHVFPEVQEEVVLLLAYGYQAGSCSALAWYQCETIADAASCSPRAYRPRESADRWSTGFVSDDAASVLDHLVEEGHFVELGSWGRIALGAVTGGNDYFVLSQEDARTWGLSYEQLVPLCPPGSGHLRHFEFSKSDWGALLAAGKKAYLLAPEGEPDEALWSYLEHGIELGINQRYKCRKRTPWWKVPIGSVPDAFITYMNAYGPNIAHNAAGVRCLNSCHGIWFDDSLRFLGGSLSLAAFNSASLLSAEMVGRSYGGGVLKLEPREAARWLVPSPDLVAAVRDDLEGERGKLSQDMRGRKFDEARRVITRLTLEKVLDTHRVRLVEHARFELSNRRHVRARGGAKRS